VTRLTTPATAVIVAFFATALLPRATWPLVDPDVWWHIRAGQEVIDTGSVPRIDTWSLIAAGGPWTSQDWLANVLLAIGNRLGSLGWMLLSLLFALIAVASFAVLWKAISARASAVGWLGRVTWLSAGLLVAGPTLGVRVQVLDLLMSAAVIWLLWRFLADGRLLWPAFLPLVAVLWVNLHAGWPLLFLLGGAVIIGEGLDTLLHRHVVPSPPQPRSVAILGVALLASALLLVANPNGGDIYRYPLDTLGLGALKGAVGEWQPVRLDSLFGWLWVAFVGLGVVPTLIIPRGRLRLSDALILLGLSVMAFMAVRFLLLLGPIGGVIVAANLGPAISQSPVGRPSAAMLERMSLPRRSLALPVLTVLLAVLGIGLALLRASPASQEAEIGVEQPVAAVAWLNANDPGDRIFNRYEWGGYLGLHRPDEAIYIDGRADVYGDQLIVEYVETIGLAIDPQRTLDAHRIDHVLYLPDSALGAWLDDSDRWERAYEDRTAAVWVRAD
jgi:hypothetical protein